MTRRLVAILLAAVLAVVGVAAVLLYVRGADQRALNGKRAVLVYVAAQRIPAGTTVNTAQADGLIVQRWYPADAVPDEARFSFGTDMSSLIASADIAPGRLVTKQMWETKTDSAVAALAIPPGMMALSFKVPEEERDGGAWVAGAEIAVFATYKQVPASGKQVAITVSGSDPTFHYTRLLLPRVKLISIVPYSNNQSGNSSTTTASDTSTNDASKPVVSGFAVVTVAVTQSDAEKLINASLLGNIDVALLNQASKVAPDKGVDNSALFN